MLIDFRCSIQACRAHAAASDGRERPRPGAKVTPFPAANAWTQEENRQGAVGFNDGSSRSISEQATVTVIAIKGRLTVISLPDSAR